MIPASTFRAEEWFIQIEHVKKKRFAILQAFLGMAVVGAVISKVLTRHQGQKIAETNLIAVAERSASVFTALNQQLVEFQEISRSKKDDDRVGAGHERLIWRLGER